MRATAIDWDSSYENALTRAALESERRRMALVAGVASACLLLFLIAMSVPGVVPMWMRARFNHNAPLFVGVYAVFVIYELVMRAWIGRCIRIGHRPPKWPRFLNAAIEVSIPTLLIWAGSKVLNPVESLFAPPASIYMILIVLMTLQLDGRVCAFAGFIAGTQYLSLAIYFLSIDQATRAAVGSLGGTSLILDPTPYVLRAGMIILLGLSAAFVARQLRGQFERSGRAIEDRKRAVSIFGQHVSPQVADRLLNQHSDLGPEIREVCVMFLDIRNFTAYSDSRSPAEVMNYLNLLFEPMIETINRHGGIINKFLGDGFMAVFGAPVEDGDASRHAVDAAMELVKQAGDESLPTTRIGIGLHAGPVITGNLGSAGRMEYTVIGGVVNLASRVEQLNKQFDSQVLATDAVVAALPQNGAHDASPLGEVQIRGQAQPVAVFRLA